MTQAPGGRVIPEWTIGDRLRTGVSVEWLETGHDVYESPSPGGGATTRYIRSIAA